MRTSCDLTLHALVFSSSVLGRIPAGRPRGQRSDNLGQIGVIAGGLAPLCVDLMAGWCDHEDSALLHWVTLHLGLSVTRPVGTQAGSEHAQGAYASHSTPERQGSKRPPLGVRKEANGVRIAAGEVIEVRDSPTPDHHHTTAELTNLGLGLEYVSNLLTTEQSAEVADEDQDCSVVRPAGRERNCVPVSVEDRDVGERVGIALVEWFMLSHGFPVVTHSLARATAAGETKVGVRQYARPAMIALYSFFSFKARKIATIQKIMAQPVTASDGSSLDENMKTMNGSM